MSHPLNDYVRVSQTQPGKIPGTPAPAAPAKPPTYSRLRVVVGDALVHQQVIVTQSLDVSDRVAFPHVTYRTADGRQGFITGAAAVTLGEEMTREEMEALSAIPDTPTPQPE